MYKKGNYIKFREFLEIQDWGKMFEGMSVQYCYTEFLRIYKIGFETFIPKIDVSGNFKRLTSGMQSDMQKRLNLWHASKRSK